MLTWTLAGLALLFLTCPLLLVLCGSKKNKKKGKAGRSNRKGEVSPNRKTDKKIVRKMTNKPNPGRSNEPWSNAPSSGMELGSTESQASTTFAGGAFNGTQPLKQQPNFADSEMSTQSRMSSIVDPALLKAFSCDDGTKITSVSQYMVPVKRAKQKQKPPSDPSGEEE